MRKIRLTICIVMSVCLCVACNKQSDGSLVLSPAITQPTDSDATQSQQADHAEFVPEEGMTELRLMCNWSYSIVESNANALNWYLQENGYPFYITVIQGRPLIGIESITEHHQTVLSAMENGEQVDLLISTPGNGYYTEEIEQGVFLALDSYLASEEAATLKMQFPESYWQAITRSEGDFSGIYGLYSGGDMMSRDVIYINAKVFEAAGIPVPEELAFDLDIIEAWFGPLWDSGVLDEYGIISPIVMSGTVTSRTLALFQGMCSDGWGEYLQYNDNQWSAVNLYESEKFNELLERLYEWNADGHLALADVLPNSESYAIMFANIDMGMKSVEAYTKDHVKAYVVNEYLDTTDAMVGIASWSKNADMAFELLKLLYTDANAACLLYYGEYAEAVPEGTEANRTMFSWANHLLLEKSVTAEEKELYLTTVANATSAPKVDRRLLNDLEQPEAGTTSQVVDMSLQELFACKTKEAFLEAVQWHKTEAERIGYFEVIEAWNKELTAN